MRYLVINFQKSSSAGGPPFSTPLNLRFWWPEVAQFSQIMVFQLIMTKLNLENQLW